MLRTTGLHPDAGEAGFEIEKVKTLDFVSRLPQPPKGTPNYLGAFRVRYLETDRQERQRTEVGKVFAGECGWPWLAAAEPVVTPLGTMLFGVEPRPPHQRHEAPALDLIFVGGRRSAGVAETSPSLPFLLTLPVLALCHLKVRNSADNIRFHWLAELAEREGKLRGLLPGPEDLNQNPLQLLDRNDQITTWQAEVVDAVVHVQAELRTMRVNRDNFAAAASQAFKRVAGRLQYLLIDRWMRGTELQAENDLGYVEGALQLAETHFKSIAASAEADQARALKRINWWVIILGVSQAVIALVSAYLAWKALVAPPSSAPPPDKKAATKPLKE
jgi:hypothetical protein